MHTKKSIQSHIFIRLLQSAKSSAVLLAKNIRGGRDNPVLMEAEDENPTLSLPEKPIYLERQKQLQPGSLILLSHPYLPGPTAYRVTQVDVTKLIVRFRSEADPSHREYFTYMNLE